MVASLVGHVIEPYDRAARLYPALICFIPVMAVAVGVHGAALGLNGSLVTVAASFGVLFLLMSISRDLGKRLEPKLFEEWGGKPTTQLLRHSDLTIDPITKKRYHSFLGRHLDVQFPSEQEEAADLKTADQAYQGGAKWLLEKTRSKAKFPLVFKENVNYGFRRNCLGMKPIGLFISLLAMAWVLAFSGVFGKGDVSLQSIASVNMGSKVAFFVSLATVAVWGLLVTKASVHRVALAYADMLLRACDALPKKR